MKKIKLCLIRFCKHLHTVIQGKCQSSKFLKCLILCDFREEDIYRSEDEIEKEKELLIHERGSSGMFGIIYRVLTVYSC